MFDVRSTLIHQYSLFFPKIECCRSVLLKMLLLKTDYCLVKIGHVFMMVYNDSTRNLISSFSTGMTSPLSAKAWNQFRGAPLNCSCVQICQNPVHLGQLSLQLHAHFTIAETMCMHWGLHWKLKIIRTETELKHLLLTPRYCVYVGEPLNESTKAVSI